MCNTGAEVGTKQLLLLPESVTSLHHIAKSLDSTAVRNMPTEPLGAAKIFQFHCKTNILHSVLTLKSRIQVLKIENEANSIRSIWNNLMCFR